MTNSEIINNFPEQMNSGKPFIIGKSKDFKMQGIDYTFIYFACNSGLGNLDMICEERISILRCKQRMLLSYATKEKFVDEDLNANLGKICEQFKIIERHETYPDGPEQEPRRYGIGPNQMKVIGERQNDGNILPTYSHNKLYLVNSIAEPKIIHNSVPIEDATYLSWKASQDKTTEQKETTESYFETTAAELLTFEQD